MVEPHDRNVYILGAGFSADAGAPLVNSFLDRSREFLLDPSSGLDEIERAQFQDVFDFRRRVAQAREKVILDLDNIEQLYGMIEIHERLGGTTRTRANVQYLIVKTLQLATSFPGWRRPTVRFAARVISHTVDALAQRGVFRNEAGSVFTADLYNFFAALIGGQLDGSNDQLTRRDSVITFNYDLVLESALERIGVACFYGLPEAATQQSPPQAPSVTILKLHGSANWAVCNGCQGSESVVVVGGKVTENPSLLRDEKCPRCAAQSYTPLLIPPSWDKSEYREITRTIWSRAVEELQRATRICVVGYSMPEVDAFFKYLVTLGLSENDRLFRFIVVDKIQSPDEPSGEQGNGRLAKSLEQKYREMLDPLFHERRFVMHQGGLAQFVSGPALAVLNRGGNVGAVLGMA